MKRIAMVLLILSVSLLFLGPGCIQPPTNETTSQTNISEQPKIVLFYDPSGENTKDRIISRVKIHLPSVQIEERCVDFARLQYNIPTESERRCIERDGSENYMRNMNDILMLIQNGATSPMYLYQHEEYKQVDYSLNPLVIANNICDVYAFQECADLPEPPSVKATLYVHNASDPAVFDRLLTAIGSYGVKINYTTKIAEESDIEKIRESTEANFLPVVLTDSADVDSQIVLDMFVQEVNNAGGNLKFEKIETRYAIYPQSMTAAYYIGSEPFINAISYVPESNPNGWMGVFEGFSAEGLLLNITYVPVSGEAAVNISEKTGELFLPLLVIQSDNLTAEQNRKISSLVGKPVTGSGVTRYLKRNGDSYVGYITYATPELYTGKKIDNVTIDIYVMSHCPYGLQMQKAVIPVIETLGPTGKLDVNNKFVSYIMHGDIETTDNLIEYCVGQNFPSKEWQFLRCFIENNGDSTKCISTLNLDKNLIDNCAASTRSAYGISGTSFPIYKNENEQYEVRGSPTVVFMGRQITLARDPEVIKDFVCDVLSQPPAACNKTLVYNIQPGFGPINGTGSSTSSGTCG
ncbi:MAG: hypothetical protein QW171_04485 [Candidatus Bilamarchaeaceae archaeon]